MNPQRRALRLLLLISIVLIVAGVVRCSMDLTRTKTEQGAAEAA
jgi:uncharacterized membrane protein HdeD (DUF308 family)